MKKLFTIIFITFLSINNLAHKQHVHQYLTIEAYKLLKLHIGYDIPTLYDRLGGTSSFYIGDRPWQRGYITTGAWREDEEDVVYRYSKTNPPTITGVVGVLNEIIAAFGGLTPDGFVSSTHFWYADNGDNVSTTINAAIDLGILGTHTFNFTVPNAYQKIQKFINGGWILHYNYGQTVGSPGYAFCTPPSYPIIGIAFEYDNLIEFFKTGKAYGLGFRGISGSWQYCDKTLIYFGQEFRERITWEILGRMCHLLQDMSIAAHANIDPHGDNDALRIDSYENYFGYDYYWNANNVYSQIGSIINPYQSSKPIHFLMYITNQMANHFGSNGPHMNQPNDNFGGNPLPEEIVFLNSMNISQFGPPTTMTHPLTNAQIINIRDKMFPQAIRATTGLLYWFAVETNLIPPPPPIPPIISGFTQTPIPICKGSTGYVDVNLSQGNGQLTYNWRYEDKPSYVSVTFSGDRATITNNYTGYRYASDPQPEAGIFTLYCTVKNSIDSSSSYFIPSVSTSCGCPTLAFEENGELLDENPLLISSLSNPGVDVTDYYLINTPVAPVNNQLKFTIHEPETEHTWFDQVSVIETRVNTNEYVAVTSDGEIVNYQRPVTPFQMTLNDSIDVTEMLADLDGNKISVESGDYITVTIIRGESGEEEDNMIMGGEEPGPPQKKIAGNVKFISNVNLERNKTAIDDNILQEGFTEDYGNFYFRPNLSIICNRLGNLPNGNLQISFNQAADLDYLVIAKNLRSARTRELEMLEAQHNIFGNIKNSLNQVDEIYGEIFPGERIDFTFAANEGQGRRAYILKTVGRYETDSAYIAGKVAGLQESQNNNIILENALFDNYPNPFNPATIISYSIKETGLVSVKVYDILGSVVATLVNESKPAGIYEVEFNASNLSSGVYFYSISVKDFHQVKKMLLIK